MKQPYEIGTETPWKGWLELTDSPAAITLRIGDRGIAHDEPPTYAQLQLTLEQAAELRDYLARVTVNVEPSATRQYEPRPCDGCGELVESERDRYAWAGQSTRIGWRLRSSWFGHIRCIPASLSRGW